MNFGNPQCVVLGPLPDEARFNRLGPALEHHAMFPGALQRRVRARRGARRGADSDLGARGRSDDVVGHRVVRVADRGGGVRRRRRATPTVIAPGGAQRVEWRDDSVYLTGWAEVLFDGEWLRELAASECRQIPRTRSRPRDQILRRDRSASPAPRRAPAAARVEIARRRAASWAGAVRAVVDRARGSRPCRTLCALLARRSPRCRSPCARRPASRAAARARPRRP